MAKRFGVLYSAARIMACPARPRPWTQPEEARFAWEVRHGIRLEAPPRGRGVTPAQRGAETRRRNEAAARAAEIAELLPERKQRCAELRAEVIKLAHAGCDIAAAEPSPAMIDAAQKLFMPPALWTELHRLAD